MIDMTVFSTIDGMEHGDEQQKYDGVRQKCSEFGWLPMGRGK